MAVLRYVVSDVVRDGLFFWWWQLTAIIETRLHDGHPLAPKPVNHGRQTARLQNNYFLGASLAVLLCRATNGKVFAVTIDREDLERVLEQGRWHVINVDATKGRVQLYVVCRKQGKTIYLHRFITNAPPKSSGVEVDHKYLRTMDNRKSELEITTKSANQRNRRISRFRVVIA